MTNVPSALALEHVEKRFGTLPALTDASLNVRSGTVHALLGENGAGKTTLMRVAYGMERPDGGMVRIDGKPVQLRTPADAIARGIGMVHQHFTLVPAMTVAENLALGAHGMFSPHEAAARVDDIARATGFSVDADARVRDLPVTAQQRLELLKLLSREARVLVLDEPTSVLAPTEADQLLRQLRLLADTGRAVVLITHKLREALAVADDVTVLRRGSTILSGSRSEIDEQQLVEAMLGDRPRGPSNVLPNAVRGGPVIVAKDVTVTDARGSVRIRDATFEIRSGELVGVAAVEGSGHRELLRAIAGRLPITTGTLELPSTVGFVPDDRHRDGLVLGMSLTENYALKRAGQRHGAINWREMAALTRDILRDFDVRADGDHVRADVLSGGNQQKFVLGRELQGFPPALVVENPTRGLDLRAAAYVRNRLLDACRNGVAVVVHAADLEEVISMAMRILVVYAGRVRELPVDADLAGRAMLGAA